MTRGTFGPPDDALPASSYFGRGYYHLYRNYLLPVEQTRAEAGFLLRRLRPRTAERWLDLPCGYGRHLAALAEARPDLRLAGGDLNMAYLREPELAGLAHLAACDMRRLPFADGVFAVVLNLLNSFGYYPPARRKSQISNFKFQIKKKKQTDKQSSNQSEILNLKSEIPLDDRDMLAECARVLRRRGWLVLDLANRRALIDLVRRQSLIRYTGGQYEAIEHFEWDAQEEVLRNETFWTWPGGSEQASYRLRLYTPAQIKKMLMRAGLKTEDILGGFDGSPFDPHDSDRMLVLARRL